MPKKWVPKTIEPFFVYGLGRNRAAPTLNPYEELERAEEEAQASQVEDEEDTTPILSHDLLMRGLSRLGPVDRGLITALKIEGLTQAEYGSTIGMTQAGTNYRLGIAMKRCRWFTVEEGSWFTATDIKRTLDPYLPGIVVALLCVFWLTGNVHETSRRLGLNQGRGMHRWISYMRRLAALAAERPDVAPVYEALSALKVRKLKLVVRRDPAYHLRHTELARARMKESWVKRRLGWKKPKPEKKPRVLKEPKPKPPPKPRGGWHHSPESRAQISARQRGKKFSPEARARMCLAQQKRRAAERQNPAESTR